MSQSRTRKSLAVGSVLALGLAGLSAQPAMAVDYMTTGLTTGDSYNFVTGSTASLSTSISPTVGGTDDGSLKYRIENPGLVSWVAAAGNAVAETLVLTGSDAKEVKFTEYGKTTPELADGGAMTGEDRNDNDVVIDLHGSDTIGEYTVDNLLTLTVKDGTATDYSLTVTAWIDTNSNNKIDATEYVATSRTIKFWDEVNIATTTAMSAPVSGATSVGSTFTTTPELNGEQLGADYFDVSFTAQGNTNPVLAKNTSSDAALSPAKGTTTYDGVSNTWTSTAYLAYSDADDAWNGTNSSVTSAIDLSSTPATAIVSGAFLTTVGAETHGLGASNSGSFVVTIAGLDVTTDSATPPSADIDTYDVVATAVAIVDADTFTFTPAVTTDFTAGTVEDIAIGSALFYSVGANSGLVVGSGTYSATPYLDSTKLGSIASTGASSIAANDTKATITGSVNITGGANADGGTETSVILRALSATSVTATATIYYNDSNGVATVAPAGVPVTGYITNIQNSAVTQINASGVGVVSDVELTDANGQVSFTITNAAAVATDGVDLEIRPLSLASGAGTTAEFDIDWAAADYTLYDMNDAVTQPATSASSFRSINAGGTYTYSFALVDQWGTAAADDTYRLQVINADRTVNSGYVTLTNGRASYVVADAAQGSNAYITTSVNVQKLTAGTWGTIAADSWNASNNGKVQINVVAAQTDAILLDADAAQLYEYDNSASVAADHSDATAAATTVVSDRRTSTATQAVYTNDAVIHGRVVNASTSAQRGGALVTISGDSSILFSAGNVDSFGSISLMASSEGDFTVSAFSNKVQLNSVVTITTADGATKTQKITFTAVAATTGANVVISAPATAASGSTFSVTATVTDKYGNPINTATNDQLQVTYAGPGIVFGTLPNDTGALGTITFAVLLGSNDKGTATITVTLDQSDNGVFTDAVGGLIDDITATASVVVGGGVVASGDTKVNVGTFKGYVALYAKGYEGQKMSAIVAGKWIVVESLASDFERVVRFTGAGYTITTKIYIDGVMIGSEFTTVTK